MNILIISHLFPQKYLKHYGIFVFDQIQYLSTHNLNIQVLAPLPKTFGILALLSKKWKNYQESIFYYHESKVNIDRPLYFQFPRFLFFKIVAKSFFKAVSNSKLFKTNFKPDIIHAHFLYPDSYAAIKLKSQFPDTKIIATVHGSDLQVYPEKSEAIKQFLISILQQLDSLIVVSQSLSVIAQKFVNTKINVIPNGFDERKFVIQNSELSDFKKRNKYSENTRVILFVGNIIKHKGIDELLDAFRILKQKKSSWKLVMVGRNYFGKDLYTKIEQYGISDDIKIYDSVPHEQIKYFYKSSDIFCLPSYTEGLPTVIIEAMAMGLPVIATKVGGIPELIEDGVNGYLVSPGDVKNLAEKIENLLPQAVREKFGRENKKKAYENYSYAVVSKKIYDEYLRILNVSA